MNAIFLSAMILNSNPCGLSGSVEERIRDCRGMGETKKGFRLVSQDSSGHYLVLDEKTNLIWSQHLKVKQQLQYYGKVDINTIHSICKRFQPFGLISNGGWRLPTLKELKCTVKRGNEANAYSVLTANQRTLSRLVFNGYNYEEEYKNVPVVLDESSRDSGYVEGSIAASAYRCVIDREMIESKI